MSETPAYTPEVAERLERKLARLSHTAPAHCYVQAGHLDLRSALAEIARLQSREAELAGALQAMREDAAGTREDYERLKPHAHADQLNFMRGWFECAEHYIPALSPSPGEVAP